MIYEIKKDGLPWVTDFVSLRTDEQFYVYKMCFHHVAMEILILSKPRSKFSLASEYCRKVEKNVRITLKVHYFKNAIGRRAQL